MLIDTVDDEVERGACLVLWRLSRVVRRIRAPLGDPEHKKMEPNASGCNGWIDGSMTYLRLKLAGGRSKRLNWQFDCNSERLGRANLLVAHVVPRIKAVNDT